MNIDTIRKQLISLSHQEHFFSYYGSRGQTEEFKGIITHVYPRTFIVQTNSGWIKCFSFSDYITKILKIS